MRSRDDKAEISAQCITCLFQPNNLESAVDTALSSLSEIAKKVGFRNAGHAGIQQQKTLRIGEITPIPLKELSRKTTLPIKKIYSYFLHFMSQSLPYFG